jgi:hypothetical protein
VTRRERFAAGFYEQARSDWQVYERLTKLGLPKCHELHYLQMACEKLAKAYRLREDGADVNKVITHHVGFVKFVNTFLLSSALLEEYEGQIARHKEVRRTSAAIAREVEKLAPAVDRAWSPENAEYPWESGETVVTPCAYAFPGLSLLSAPGGRAFLKLIERAFRDY